MKAIRIHQPGGPEVLKLEEIADLKPSPDEVVVRTRAIGVNPVDTYIRAGNYGKLDTPYIPGKDAAGEVESFGANVTNLKIGQRVYIACTSGAYAEQVLCKAANAYPLPDRISFAQGAAVAVPYATAYRALFQKAMARPGETVLIHGASGGVGTAAVQFGRAAGLVVIGTGGTKDGRELVMKNGAHHVLDHHAPDYLKRGVEEITGGRGFDVIVEMIANVNLDKDLDAVAPNGRIVIVGNRGTVEIDPRKAMGRESRILGLALLVAPENEVQEAHAAIVAGLENGSLTPVVGKEMPLAEAAKAHEEVLKPGAYGKIVLVP